MATIGTFRKTGDAYTGEIVTLSVQARRVRIVPAETRASDSAPSHRVFVGAAEIGAGWTKTSQGGRAYLALKLDDPSFAAPVFANLVEGEDGESYRLIWSRPSDRRED
ncbi:DUF736 domain-containing protein [Rubellimicrobium aerolatum]|uniref:DUF736 domain-containing protein n=1 Tax=Rubellimicrobium aerolatum TaxID=490979 RepID=A0ABW0SDZ5_9RHOB